MKKGTIQRIILMCVLLGTEVLFNTYFNMCFKNNILATEFSSTNSLDKKLVHEYSTPLSLTTNKSSIISGNDLSEYEINLLCQVVQHEVGYNESYFPGYDFDYIQQLMTKVVLNRIGRNGFKDTLYEVICQKGQFMPIENLSEYDPYETTTRKNVLHVINKEDNISEDLIFEMSFSSTDLYSNIYKMELQVGDIQAYYSAITANNRQIIFATSNFGK